jgi:hypothetical protein
MTEDEWLAAEESGPMLEFLRGKATDRKLRLFSVACFARLEDHGMSEDARFAVACSELFADRGMSPSELAEVQANALFKLDDYGHTAESVRSAVRCLTDVNLIEVVRSAGFILDALGYIGFEDEEMTDEQLHQAVLLRHIIGNPFRPPQALAQVPIPVRERAEAVYRQDRAAVGPLHDALLDAGLSDLADHFTDAAEWHPKGCWAIDLITGRA